jgi:hypothetical protein
MQTVKELKGMDMEATTQQINKLKEELREQLPEEVWQHLLESCALPDIPSAPSVTIPECKVLASHP